MDSKLFIICVTSICSTVFICALIVSCRCKHPSNTIPLSVGNPCSDCNVMRITVSKGIIDCAICLDTLVENDITNDIENLPVVVTLSKCNHVYHKLCIESLLRIKTMNHVKCPKCRLNICLGIH